MDVKSGLTHVHPKDARQTRGRVRANRPFEREAPSRAVTTMIVERRVQILTAGGRTLSLGSERGLASNYVNVLL